MYMTMHNEMVVGGAVQEVDVGTTLGETTVDIVSPRSGVKKKKGVNVLDIPWTPPEIEKAKRYADYVQPRKDVKDGEIPSIHPLLF